jgi:hypothetical protein
LATPASSCLTTSRGLSEVTYCLAVGRGCRIAVGEPVMPLVPNGGRRRGQILRHPGIKSPCVRGLGELKSSVNGGRGPFGIVSRVPDASPDTHGILHRQDRYGSYFARSTSYVSCSAAEGGGTSSTDRVHSGTASDARIEAIEVIMRTGKYLPSLIAVCLIVAPSLAFARTAGAGGARARAGVGAAIMAPSTLPSAGTSTTTTGMSAPTLRSQPGAPNTTTPGMIGTQGSPSGLPGIDAQHPGFPARVGQ